MITGQYVTRADGTRWQAAGNRVAYQGIHGSLRGVETVIWQLVRRRPDSGIETAWVEIWGTEAAARIGRPSEQLRLDPDQVTPI